MLEQLRHVVAVAAGKRPGERDPAARGRALPVCAAYGVRLPYRGTSHGEKEAGMNVLAEILAEKGHDVLTIDADATVLEAVKQMVEANVGSLLVTEGGSTAGIVTERDYLRRAALAEGADDETPVREIMTSALVVATPETPIDECMALMTERRIRHVPVVEGGDVVGLVSIGDLVKFKSKQQSFEIQYLTEYITAGRTG
jgi:CBS domain-containing protein